MAQSGPAKAGALYGAMYKDKLIPEVVKRGALEIGRFEVTRAQYKTWDNGYPVPADTENYPASGITLPQAQGYTEWLSQLTGQIYRVPNEEETGDLYKPTAGENTLEYWKGQTSKLKEVGSFKGNSADDQEPIFDLGGNVSELVLTKDGKGKTVGGSADRPARDRTTPAEPDFTGFRIIRVGR